MSTARIKFEKLKTRFEIERLAKCQIELKGFKIFEAGLRKGGSLGGKSSPPTRGLGESQVGVVKDATILNENEGTGQFKYIYVFELTRNKGIHVHGFFSGFYDLYINDYGHLSSHFFDKLGFQSFIPRNEVNENYLLKYITKEPIKEFKCRYFRSRNLNLPIVSRFPDALESFTLLPFTFKGKYSSIVNIKK